MAARPQISLTKPPARLVSWAWEVWLMMIRRRRRRERKMEEEEEIVLLMAEL